ncbi:hypothetical protein AB0L71_28115 [Streptomyces sp. NPDC052052]|uniref:hypothetical protein n=1 Tax=Streptomyces sp. NPDC052052 TaxID=3154756 RepID=UPI00344299E1
MTTTPELAAMWHDDITINGQPYPTRHPCPDDVTTTEDCFDDLPVHHHQYLTAVHEAGHAVAALVARACVHSATIKPLSELVTATPTTTGTSHGNTINCNFPDGQTSATCLGAGERAADRWLHQNNLWTPRRALGIELSAYGDRCEFLAANPHFGFGADRNDYRVVHDLADQLITQHWDAVTAVADALVTRLHLTGDQIARIADLPNGTHSATCTA